MRERCLVQDISNEQLLMCCIDAGMLPIEIGISGAGRLQTQHKEGHRGNANRTEWTLPRSMN
jgi:hypothetical protein